MGFAFIKVYKDGTTFVKTGAPCYADLTYRKLGDKLEKVLLLAPDIEKKEVAQWVEQLNKWGFKMSFCYNIEKLKKSEPEELKYFSENCCFAEVPLYNDDNTLVHPDKRFFVSTIMLFRYILEFPDLVACYFKYVNDYPDEDTWKLLQVAHINTPIGNPNHTLFSGRAQKVLPLEFFLKKLDGAYPTLEYEHSTYISDLYETPIRNTKDIKKLLSSGPEEPFPKIYVVGGNTTYARWIPNHKIVDSIEHADIVLFTGGEDVDPSLYNEKPHPKTYSNIDRDNREQKVFKEAKKLKKKMIGICRGSQFLCVMSGGKLVQHQENPNFIHPIYVHKYGEIDITSTHHQAQFPYNLPYTDYMLVGYCHKPQSTIHLNGEGKELLPKGSYYQEAEIVIYKKTRCLCIQGHPEMEPFYSGEKYKQSRNKLIKVLNDFINNY